MNTTQDITAQEPARVDVQEPALVEEFSIDELSVREEYAACQCGN